MVSSCLFYFYLWFLCELTGKHRSTASPERQNLDTRKINNICLLSKTPAKTASMAEIVHMQPGQTGWTIFFTAVSIFRMFQWITVNSCFPKILARNGFLLILLNTLETQVYSNNKVNYWHESVTQTNPCFGGVQKCYPLMRRLVHCIYTVITNAKQMLAKRTGLSA